MYFIDFPKFFREFPFFFFPVIHILENVHFHNIITCKLDLINYNCLNESTKNSVKILIKFAKDLSSGLYFIHSQDLSLNGNFDITNIFYQVI